MFRSRTAERQVQGGQAGAPVQILPRGPGKAGQFPGQVRALGVRLREAQGGGREEGHGLRGDESRGQGEARASTQAHQTQSAAEIDAPR